ncbi:hypothetical protein [Streptomyces sp. BH105]|uniref:hypothetical protein n=1 Tax=Streptomyces sp. BH105 TaxID=3410408 RepID=UPI003CF8466E
MANQAKVNRAKSNQAKRSDAGSGQGLLWLFGTILVVQGFGSAVTEAGWDTSFGVAALMRAAHVPEWATLLVGLAGVSLLGMAARRQYAKGRAGRRP